LTRLTRIAPLVAAIALGVSLTACAPSGGGDVVPQAAPAAPAAPSKSPGEIVFDRSCARCHGQRLEGDGKTPAIDRGDVMSLGDQRLRLLIATGKGKMPAFGKLTDQQVTDLIAYLRTMV
jgi:quinoprotein glucose dehydrogenase